VGVLISGNPDEWESGCCLLSTLFIIYSHFVFLGDPARGSVSTVISIFEIDMSFTNDVVTSDQIPVVNLDLEKRVLWKAGFHLEAPEMNYLRSLQLPLLFHYSRRWLMRLTSAFMVRSYEFNIKSDIYFICVPILG